MHVDAVSKGVRFTLSCIKKVPDSYQRTISDTASAVASSTLGLTRPPLQICRPDLTRSRGGTIGRVRSCGGEHPARRNSDANYIL